MHLRKNARKFLALTAISVAAFLPAVGTAQATPPPPTAFSCTLSNAVPPELDTGVGAHALEVSFYDEKNFGNGEGATCSGGTGDGWTVTLYIRYKNSSGVWEDGENPNHANDYTNFPYGGAVCASSDHYANYHTALLQDYYWGVGECQFPFSTPYTNDEATQDEVKYDQSGDNLWATGNSACSFGIEGWDVHLAFVDNGNSGNTDSANSSTRSC
jgi:hypothetical protein